MALDATGTPTSPDNIPKFNTAVDPPSGKGFNAAMDAIQVALSARMNKPVGVADNEVPVWDDGTSTWIRSSDASVRIVNAGTALPKVTVSAFAAGPPAGAIDGDIWIATDVHSTEVRWQFQYNPTSANTHDWEFIGGPPVRISLGAMGGPVAAGVWSNLDVGAGPDFVAPRVGEYRFWASVRTFETAAGQNVHIGIANASVSSTPIGPNASHTHTTVNSFAHLAVETEITPTAGQTVRLQYFCTNLTADIDYRVLFALPLRVS